MPSCGGLGGVGGFFITSAHAILATAGTNLCVPGSCEPRRLRSLTRPSSNPSFTLAYFITLFTMPSLRTSLHFPLMFRWLCLQPLPYAHVLL